MSVREELLRAAKVLGKLDCLPATDGNLSARIDDNKILLTRTLIEKRSLSNDGLVVVDLDSKSLPNVSSEWPMHKQIYRNRPEVNSILHVHSPGLTAFAAAHLLPNLALLAEAVMTIGEIVQVPFTKPGSEKMGENLLIASPSANVYLLSNHGALAVGTTVTETLHRLERAEFLARTELSAQSLGGGVPLSQHEIEGLIS